LYLKVQRAKHGTLLECGDVNCLILTAALSCREELEFVANTIIFILAGIVIAGRIYTSAHDSQGYIRAADWGYALLLWVYLTVHPISASSPPPLPQTSSRL